RVTTIDRAENPAFQGFSTWGDQDCCQLGLVAIRAQGISSSEVLILARYNSECGIADDYELVWFNHFFSWRWCTLCRRSWLRGWRFGCGLRLSWLRRNIGHGRFHGYFCLSRFHWYFSGRLY